MVKVPYVEGLSETFHRIVKVYRVSTTVKPHIALRNIIMRQSAESEIRKSLRLYVRHLAETVNVSTAVKLDDHCEQE